LIITVEGTTVMNITDVKVGQYTNVSAKLQDTGNNIRFMLFSRLLCLRSSRFIII
jgi:hypothetical protein